MRSFSRSGQINSTLAGVALKVGLKIRVDLDLTNCRDSRSIERRELCLLNHETMGKKPGTREAAVVKHESYLEWKFAGANTEHRKEFHNSVHSGGSVQGWQD